MPQLIIGSGGSESRPLREIKAGDRLHITGRIRIEEYTGADGTERSVCRIIASGCRKCEE